MVHRPKCPVVCDCRCSRRPARGIERVAKTTLAMLVVLALPGPSLVAAAQSDGAVEVAVERGFRFGDYLRTIDGLVDPVAVTIDRDGVLTIAEHDAIRRFDFDGNEVSAITRLLVEGSREAGARIRPGGVANGPEGTFFVSDRLEHRIVQVDVDGFLLASWGSLGTADGEFNAPAGVAVQGDQLAVVDEGNHRVQLFSLDGTHQLTVGGYGTEEGRFNRPVDVALTDDAIFVSDADNNRVQVFGLDGTPRASWGDWGPFQGLMDAPAGLVVSGDEVYVADTRNHRLQVFDAAGELRLQWGIHAVTLRQGEGLLHYPTDLAIAPSGTFGVICETFENRCQIFAALPADREVENLSPPTARKGTQSHFGERLAVDGPLLVIAEPEMHRVHVFDRRRDIPIVIGTFGERGTRPGLLIRAAGLEVDADRGVVTISDTATRRIEAYRLRFDPEENTAFDRHRARFARSINLTRLRQIMDDVDLAWEIEPVAIHEHPSGSTYLLDARNARVFEFDQKFDLLASWGGDGTETGQFREPTDFAFSRDGETVFVVDSGNARVQAFDRQGTFLRAWGHAGDGDDAFRRPFGIAAGRDGFVYVTDAALNRVQKFDEEGNLITFWGGTGQEHGLFWRPKGIVHADNDRLYVIDQGNHRAQQFETDGTWMVTFGTGRAYTAFDRDRMEEGKKKNEGDAGSPDAADAEGDK